MENGNVGQGVGVRTGEARVDDGTIVVSTAVDAIAANDLIDGAVPWRDVPVGRRRWFVWLFVCLFSPIAIYLCWSGPVYRNLARAGVPYSRRARIWFGFVLLLFLIGGIGRSLDLATEPNGRSGQAGALSSSARNDAYFTEARFTAPLALKAVYTQDDRAFEPLSTNASDIVGLYVATLADEVGEQCGKFLTANGTIKEGLLAGVAIAKSMTRTPSDTKPVLGQWLSDYSSFQELQRHGRQDADRFLSDSGGCLSRQVSILEDGIDQYFDKL